MVTRLERWISLRTDTSSPARQTTDIVRAREPVHLDSIVCPLGCGHKILAHDNDVETLDWNIQRITSEEFLPKLGKCLVTACDCGNVETLTLNEAARSLKITKASFRYAIDRGYVRTIEDAQGRVAITRKELRRYRKVLRHAKYA